MCNILMEDDEEGEDSLAPEDKAMLSKFLVATLRVASEEPTSEIRGKAKGKKVTLTKHGDLWTSAIKSLIMFLEPRLAPVDSLRAQCTSRQF